VDKETHLSIRNVSIAGVQDDLGWYGAAMKRSDFFEACESALASLQVKVDVVTIPGRERPHARGLATFRAGESLTAADVLQTRVLVRGPEEDLAGIHMANELREPFVNHVSGARTRFLVAPPIPVEIPSEVVPQVAGVIAEVAQSARQDSITLVFPQRAGPDRDATVGWLLHDLGHAIALEGGGFKEIFRPLKRMGQMGAAALESLRAADSSAVVEEADHVAMDYGPQALVNMATRGRGRRVALDGSGTSEDVRRIERRMSAEIQRRLREARGLVAVW
jgi:hypothetical protein